MYTQCPECSVVLSISATDLRAAGGEVCCGACNSVFNALHHLIDTDEEPTPSMMLEQDEYAFGDDGEPIEVEDSDPESPAGEESQAPEFQADEEKSSDREAPAAELDEESLAWSRTIAGLGLADQTTLDTLARHDQTQEPLPEVAETQVPDPVSTAPEREPDPPAMFEIVREIADHSTPETLYNPDELLGHENEQTVPWIKRSLIVAIILAAIALTLQVIHFQRNELALNPTWGPRLQTVYQKLGAPLDPNWDVKQYLIAQGGGSTDPRLPGVLLVSARLSNISDLGMPYPLIKLSLKDRWGDAVGGRTFSPPEYLDSTPEADSLLAPGGTVAVQLRVVDPPGDNANGFALDACLNTAEGLMRCAYDSP